MVEIHVVFADTNYDSNRPLKAFGSDEPAQAFAQQCREYDETYHWFGDLPGEEYGEYEKWEAAWIAAHPALAHSRAETYTRPDSYSVVRVPFVPSTTKERT